MSPWPQVAIPATQISMLLGGSIAFRHPHSLKRQTRPLTYTHPLVVTCATDISTDGFGRATVPVMALGSSPGPGITMAPGGCTSPHIHLFLTTSKSPVPRLSIGHKPLDFAFCHTSPLHTTSFPSLSHLFFHQSGACHGAQDKGLGVSCYLGIIYFLCPLECS